MATIAQEHPHAADAARDEPNPRRPPIPQFSDSRSSSSGATGGRGFPLGPALRN
jgi:hypothetical protein